MGVRMKKFLIVLLPISLFVFSCEDNDVVDTSEGVKLEWIGFGSKIGVSNGEYVFWVDTKPSFPESSLLDDYSNNNWDWSYKCDDIELFQSEGYFNFILSNNPTLKLTYQLDEFSSMVWKE
jgi:hypothetical protein